MPRRTTLITRLGYAPGSGSALWAKGHTWGLAPYFFSLPCGGAKPRLTSGGGAVLAAPVLAAPVLASTRFDQRPC